MLASGACNVANVPPLQHALPASIACLTPLSYRNPDQLPEGGVLIVGASATGVQLAEEIHSSGRRVTLSVGEHVRLPRTYRGRDVLWWMDASGIWNERYDEIDDLTRARRLPSPQLVGTPERTTLDLNALSAAGVELVGRLAAVRDGRALFSGGLRNQFALADLKMDRLLDTFDGWARTHTLDADVGPPERLEPTRVPASSRLISTSGVARSVPSSGRPGFARTTAGSTFRCSIARDTCGTMEGLSMRQGCMPSGCPSSGDESRPSSMAPRMTRAT